MIESLMPVEFLGNTVAEYAYATGIFAVTAFALTIFKQYLLHRVKAIANRTAIGSDNFLFRIVESFPIWFFLFLAVAAGYSTLTVPEWMDRAAFTILVAVLVYQVTIAIQVLINYFVQEKLDHKKDKGHISAITLFGNVIKGVVWAIAVMFALSNMGVNITSLIAGLGIGGVAIAFALQNILEDLFSSFAIYFDKPFAVGDFIVVGDHMGTVERIGIKTTRLRSLQGEEIVISNRELTDARIQNFRTLNERRVVFSFGVLYQTPQETLKRIPLIVQNIIENTANVRFDRAHFKAFGDSALLFEVVYHVTDRTYDTYMDANQSIHFGLKEIFAKEGIEFAYPTQTIHIQK